jgi:hypothetical protein
LSSRLTFNAEAHAYWLADLNGGRKRRLPSVTTLLKQLDKPALTRWAANTAADYAIDEWDTLALMSPSERRKLIAAAPWQSRDRAAATGTAIHDMAERLLGGAPVEVPEIVRGQVEGLARWLEASDVAMHYTEAQVWAEDDEELGLCAYAGTLDAIVEHPTRGLGLVDFKTGSGIYSDFALQLAGYARAENLVYNDEDEGMPDIRWLGALHVRSDGTTLHTLTYEAWMAARDRFDLLRSLTLIPEPTWNQEIGA